MSLNLTHLVLVSLWGGLVAAELTLEVVLSHRAATKLHYWIDLLFELPLLGAILVTGSILTARHSPLDALHIVKVTSGLIAVLLAAICVVLVVLRNRALLKSDEGLVNRYSRLVAMTSIGVPFGLVAAYIGLTHFV